MEESASEVSTPVDMCATITLERHEGSFTSQSTHSRENTFNTENGMEEVTAPDLQTVPTRNELRSATSPMLCEDSIVPSCEDAGGVETGGGDHQITAPTRPAARRPTKLQAPSAPRARRPPVVATATATGRDSAPAPAAGGDTKMRPPTSRRNLPDVVSVDEKDTLMKTGMTEPKARLKPLSRPAVPRATDRVRSAPLSRVANVVQLPPTAANSSERVQPAYAAPTSSSRQPKLTSAAASSGSDRQQRIVAKRQTSATTAAGTSATVPKRATATKSSVENSRSANSSRAGSVVSSTSSTSRRAPQSLPARGVQEQSPPTSTDNMRTSQLGSRLPSRQSVEMDRLTAETSDMTTKLTKRAQDTADQLKFTPLGVMAQKVEHLESEVTARDTRLAELELRRVEMETALVERVGELASRNVALAEREAALAESEARIVECSRQAEENAATAEARSEEIQALQERLQAATAELTSLQEEARAEAELRLMAEGRLAEAQTQLEKIERSHQEELCQLERERDVELRSAQDLTSEKISELEEMSQQLAELGEQTEREAASVAERHSTQLELQRQAAVVTRRRGDVALEAMVVVVRQLLEAAAKAERQHHASLDALKQQFETVCADMEKSHLRQVEQERSHGERRVAEVHSRCLLQMQENENECQRRVQIAAAEAQQMAAKRQQHADREFTARMEEALNPYKWEIHMLRTNHNHKPLMDELESLNAVLELKNEEVRKTRRQLEDAKAQLTQMDTLKQELVQRTHETENYRAIAERRSEEEKQMAARHRELLKKYEQDKKKMYRMSQQNDELMFTLHSEPTTPLSQSINLGHSSLCSPISPTLSPAPLRHTRTSKN